MLSPLQRQVAEIIAGLDAAEGFGLAGGAALIVRGDIDRRTQDLDFFGLEQADVQRLLPAVETALEVADLQVRRVREGIGFVRLAVTRGDEVTEVDLAAGSPSSTAQSTRYRAELSQQVSQLWSRVGRSEWAGVGG